MTPLEQIIAAVLERAAGCAQVSRDVFSGSCDHTHQSIDYMEQVIRALPVAEIADELADKMPGEPVAWRKALIKYRDDLCDGFCKGDVWSDEGHSHPDCQRDCGGCLAASVLLAHPSDAVGLRAEVERLTAELESATRGRNDWRDDFMALSSAIVGDTGLSAMTVAAQARLFRPRAEKAEAERDAALEQIRQMRAIITMYENTSEQI